VVSDVRQAPKEIGLARHVTSVAPDLARDAPTLVPYWTIRIHDSDQPGPVHLRSPCRGVRVVAPSPLAGDGHVGREAGPGRDGSKRRDKAGG
jgi:hypothetical protein